MIARKERSRVREQIVVTLTTHPFSYDLRVWRDDNLGDERPGRTLSPDQILREFDCLPAALVDGDARPVLEPLTACVKQGRPRSRYEKKSRSVGGSFPTTR
jgi:hypothetical protein